MFCCSRSKIPKISMITFKGTISSDDSLCYEKQRKLIKQAFEVPNISAVVLIINSPGGSPVQSELIFKYIRIMATEKEVSVFTFIEDIGASGGYFLAIAGDSIYASNSSIIGSIGVISSGFGFHELIKNYGVERRIYAQGENKALLDPFLPQKDSDVEILNDISKDIHSEFIEWVKSRRGDKLKLDEPGLFSGKIWSAKKAEEIGLIDGVGHIDLLLSVKFGKEFEIIHISEPKTLMSYIKSMIGIEFSFKSIIDTLAKSSVKYIMREHTQMKLEV